MIWTSKQCDGLTVKDSIPPSEDILGLRLTV